VLCVGAAAGIAEGTFQLMASAIVPTPYATLPDSLLSGAILSNLTSVAVTIINYPKGTPGREIVSRSPQPLLACGLAGCC
jgi:hypothetical protein